MKITTLLLTACLLASFGCDIGDDFVALDTEPLTVTVTTVGAHLDADGYMLSITGVHDEPIGVDESKVFNVLRIAITVELGDVAANCTAIGNPRTVDVRGPTTVSFVVECI